MDLGNAILAHQQWKSRLNQFLGGTSKEQLDPDVVGRDDQCELGRWIHGQGALLFHDAEDFHKLQQCHARFHKKAGEVVRLKVRGNTRGAQEAFDRDFGEDSLEIAVAIQRLKRLVPAR